MKLSDFKTIHFIGIGGIGMSALARLCLHEGKRVSGSNRDTSAITDALVEEGVTFFSTQVASNLSAEIDLVVYTEAMSHDQEEMVAAKALGVPVINYFEALGMVANEYYLIAVAGSHGKTTTTAMLIDIFEAAGLDPSAIVGSLRAATKSNYRAGKSKYFIAEACEYRRDFLSLQPDVLVITNIEHEHVDYYKDLAAVQAAFREFALQVREGGVVVANVTDPALAPVLASLPVRVIDYRDFLQPFRTLMMPGLHNQMNAAAAAAAASVVGITKEQTDTALAAFAGTWRRFEYKGEVNGAKVYDDYGHHPTEIRATLVGTRELYPERSLTVIFQSHTYSRTSELFADFVSALALADRVLLLPIYAAREENVSGVTHQKLADAIALLGTEVTAYETFSEVVEAVKDHIGETDVVLAMGAGTVTEVGDLLTK